MAYEEQTRIRDEENAHTNPREIFAGYFHIATTNCAAFAVNKMAEAREEGRRLLPQEVTNSIPSGARPETRRPTHTQHVGSLYVSNFLLGGVLKQLGVITQDSDYRYSLSPGTDKAVRAARIALDFYNNFESKVHEKDVPSTGHLFRNAGAQIKDTGNLASASFARAELLLQLNARGEMSANNFFELSRRLYPPETSRLSPHVGDAIMKRLEMICFQGFLKLEDEKYSLTEAGKVVVDDLLLPLAQLAGYDPLKKPEELSLK